MTERQPSPPDLALAAYAVDSLEGVSDYASCACAWDQISEDGQLWIAAIIRAALASAAPRMVEENRRRAIRRGAFEEAAQVAEREGAGHHMAQSCATAIRAWSDVDDERAHR